MDSAFASRVGSLLRGAGRALLRILRMFSQTQDQAFPMTQAPYRTSDATDPANAVGPQAQDDSWRSR